MIRHPNSFRTYYGHLSKIKKGIRRGVKVKQGQVVGYVGSTGLSTGPHLDYRIKKHNRFVDPLTLTLPRGGTVPKRAMADFILPIDRELGEVYIELPALLWAFLTFLIVKPRKSKPSSIGMIWVFCWFIANPLAVNQSARIAFEVSASS